MPRKNWCHLRPPANRHYLNSLTIPKSAGNGIFTISKQAVEIDVQTIHTLGDSIRTGQSFTVPPSGRVYSFHDDILYPVVGPGMVQITSAEYNILKTFKNNPANALKYA